MTGASGFVGNRLVLSLLREGSEVVCLVRRRLAPKSGSAVCVLADLDDLSPTQIRKQIDGPIDCVFHLAATMPATDRRLSSFLAANGVATAVLLEAAEEWKVRCFIYASSLLVIGEPRQSPIGKAHPCDPRHPYALGKLCGEQSCELARSTGRLPTTSLRFTSVFGVGMSEGSVLPKFACRAFQSEDLLYDGTGQRVQNFVHVNDVVRACRLAADHPGAGVLSIGGKNSISMKELAELIVQLTTGSASAVKASGKDDPQEHHRWIPDLAEAEAAIGYVPESDLAAAISEYIRSLHGPELPERWWN